ncbi:MAG: Gx transporter family protein, partial [Meiothermus silvanus]|nr:Gx transporter family protein [Allomeiothermus silvanus]
MRGVLLLLVALGLVLQILEGMLPPLLPLPGAKIGLANLATLVALFVLGPWEALAVNLLRCLLGGLLRGSFVGLTISLAAGTAATLVMMAVYEAKPPGITITGLSMAGAVSHNAAQLGVAMWLVGFPGLVNYLPLLLLLALPTGFLIGVLARRLLLSLGPRPYLSAAPALHVHPQVHQGEIGQAGPYTAHPASLKERVPGGAISK